MSNSLDPDQPDVLSGLIWVQTVCKEYQQTTKVATTSRERFNVHDDGDDMGFYILSNIILSYIK